MAANETHTRVCLYVCVSVCLSVCLSLRDQWCDPNAGVIREQHASRAATAFLVVGL